MRTTMSRGWGTPMRTRVPILLAAAIFCAQAVLCGLRGFGAGEAVQRLRGMSSHAAAPVSCHGERGPDRPHGEGERCRAHCRLYGQSLASTAPKLQRLPTVWATCGAPVAPAPAFAPPAPARVSRTPPSASLRVLHASLLI
jgi:hypothetical protein